MFCAVFLILAPAASVVRLWNVLQHVRCDSIKASSSQLHVVLAALTEAPLTFGVDGTSVQTLISVGKVNILSTFVKKYKLSSFLPFVIFAVIVFIPIFFIKETSVKHDATQEMISVIDRVGY